MGCSDSSIKTLTITTGVSGTRTILPSRLDYTSLKYYFVVKNLINNQESLQVFASEDDDVYIGFPLELTEGYYRISIYALTAEKAAAKDPANFNGSLGGYNGGDLKTACVLYGATTVDLRQDEAINVALTAERLTENGVVSLNFYTNGWALDTTKFNASCYITNKAGAMVGPVDPVNISGVTNTPPAADAPALYYASLPAGTYTFCVDYTKKADSSVVYSWTDAIMVLPNQTIKKTIALMDVIQYAPAAPTNFKASYKDFDPAGPWCYVNFTWSDNSVTEKGFQIDLKAVHNSEDEASITGNMAADWEALAQDLSAVTGSFTRNATALTQAFDDTGYCVDGSLNKNNTSATFKLSRGYRYLARISAVGYDKAGSSDYCYLDLSAGGTGKTGYTAFAADAPYAKVGD